MKRRSYLAGLAAGVQGRPALQPPPILFRPAATDGGDFVETVNALRPARGAVAHMGANFAGELRTNPGDRAPLSPGPEGSGNAAVGMREMPVLLSPTGRNAESVASRPPQDRTAQPRPIVSPAALLITEPSANRPAPRTLLPPDPPKTLSDSRQRENPKTLTLMPRAPSDRAPSLNMGDRKNSNSNGAVSVRIGTLEVRIGSTTPTPQKPAIAPRAPPSPSRKVSLARGFGSFGMAQG